MEKRAYFAHINGLRGIAILGVVLYHLNAACCPAGYFGVDVFLVVTGFLMLGKLLQTDKAGAFSYTDYLEGKVYRLLPSLLVVMAAVYAVTVLLVYGQPCTDCIQTCGGMGVEIIPLLFCAYVVRWWRSGKGRGSTGPRRGGWLPLLAVGGILAAAWATPPLWHILSKYSIILLDVRIDKLGDYFSPHVQANPLLHLWYMGVTWQIYILLPLLVVPFVRRWGKKAALAVLAGAFTLSLLYQVATTTYTLLTPDRQVEVLRWLSFRNAYYHLAPRLWEVVAGAAVLLMPDCRNPQVRKALGMSGLLGLVICFYLFSTGSPCVYPAVVLALLVIKYGADGPCGCILGCKPLQAVGTISFSLYLWHWPVMALYKYFCNGAMGVWDNMAVLAISAVSGYMAWRFIERFRLGKQPGKAVPLASPPLALTGLVLAAAVGGAAVVYGKGVQNADERMLMEYSAAHHLTYPTNSASPVRMGEVPDDRFVPDFSKDIFRFPPLYLGNDTGAEPLFLLIGDSHANHLNYGMDAAATKLGVRGISLNNSVIPVWYYKPIGSFSFDAKWDEGQAGYVVDYLARHPSIRYVVISMAWRRMFTNKGQDWRTEKPIPPEQHADFFMAGLSETCKRISALGVKVILLADTPAYDDPSPCVEWGRSIKLTGEGTGIRYISTEEHYNRAGRLNSRLEALVQKGVAGAIIDPSPHLLGLAPGGCPSVKDGVFLYWDAHHFTPEGSAFISEIILKELLILHRADEGAGAPPSR